MSINRHFGARVKLDGIPVGNPIAFFRGYCERDAAEGATGYSAVVVTADREYLILRSPSQRAGLEIVETLHEYGNGERADRIVAGFNAELELERERRVVGRRS